MLAREIIHNRKFSFYAFQNVDFISIYKYFVIFKDEFE